MANELLALVDAGTVRVIDVLILTKNEDGTVDAGGALGKRGNSDSCRQSKHN